MKIKYSAYQIDKFSCHYIDEIDEFLIVPDNHTASPQKKDIIIYDSDLNVPSTICDEFVNCNNLNDILNFIKKYGVLIDPYHYTCGNPSRSFPVLLDYFENYIPAMYKRNNSLKFCNTVLTHWHSYAFELEHLMIINKYSSLESIDKEDISKLLNFCLCLLRDEPFEKILCFEYSNYHDKEEMKKILLENPICYIRYLLTYQSLLGVSDYDGVIKKLKDNKELNDRLGPSFSNYLYDLITLNLLTNDGSFVSAI